MSFLHALQGVLTIMIMVSVGYFLTHKGWFTEDSKKLLPRLVNYVALPTYMTWNLMTTFSREKLLAMLPGAIVPFIAMLISFAISYVLSIILNIPVGRRGTFRSMFFVSSAIFVGLPVNLALFGDAGVPFVLLYFLANAALFWTLGAYSISTDGKLSGTPICSLTTLKNLFSPPLTAFTIATILILAQIPLPDVLAHTFKNLGSMTTPLSMLFIGIIIYSSNLREIKFSKDMFALLIGRFIISPLAILLVASFFPIPDLMKKVFVIQSAMPAMTQTAILAKIYDADAEYAAVMTSVTTLAAMLAIPVYMVLL
ncbi:MAG: Auxin Efflux Carrier [Anaerosporomusa subterranea]|jgi:predicted permease|nr:Auxin Efflux Carrier [Anaerosporomusa subterranea]